MPFASLRSPPARPVLLQRDVRADEPGAQAPAVPRMSCFRSARGSLTLAPLTRNTVLPFTSLALRRSHLLPTTWAERTRSAPRLRMTMSSPGPRREAELSHDDTP